MPKYLITFERTDTLQATRTVCARNEDAAREKAEALQIAHEEWEMIDSSEDVVGVDQEE